MERYYLKPAQERAMKLQEVILRAASGKINWIQAAEIIGISCRQMRRWKGRYEQYGYDGLYDRRKKMPSPKRVPFEKVQKMLRLYSQKYYDFSIAHFYDKLKAEHRIDLSYNWVRLALQEAGLVAKRSRHDKHRRRRPRKPIVGMMLHMDGSPHDWFGNGTEYSVVTVSDDADNTLYDIALVPEEDAKTCMELLKNVVEKRGVFCSLYTDRGSHFFFTRKAGEEVDKENLTQIGRALAELGIKHIPSYSPQARGRCERLNGTLQGRIPQELRLRGIKTLDAANRYLKTVYLKEHNRRFRIKPDNEGSAFMPVQGLDLNRIFSFKQERTVNNDNTVHFNRRVFQISPSQLRVSFAKCKVDVYEHLDGSVSITYGPHTIGYYSPKDLNRKSRSLKGQKPKQLLLT